MKRKPIVAVLLAAMLVLAGCSGAAPGGDDTGQSGRVTFYVSDQQNAISDFSHLNATVTEVGFHRVDDPDTDANESGWVERDVDDVTVDLTMLQGENATSIDRFDLPNGTYNKVFVHVSEVNGTLSSGGDADVKLPSGKIHVSTKFTVGDGEELDFVYDLSVVETGNGKYVLKPVAKETGAGKPVKERPEAKGGSKGKAGTDTENQNETGTASKLTVYVSDEQNAMGDFAHLNVTITKVGVHRTGDNGSGGWVEKDVDGATVDLTELQGANATRLGVLDVPNGTYDKVFVYVSEVNGTLTSGEEVNVKLPSNKLHLQKEFTVGDGEDVDFVYDMSVFAAGNSGKYVLKPVVSQSGTGDQVRIEETKDDETKDDEKNDEKNDDRTDEDNESANETGDATPALNVTVTGNVTAGTNVTVTVTDDGTTVANATVRVDGAEVGTTDANGTLVVTVPDDADELEIEATKGDAEGAVTVDVDGGSTGDDQSTDEKALAAPL